MKNKVNHTLMWKRYKKTSLLQFGHLASRVGPYSFLVSYPQPNMIMIYLLSYAVGHDGFLTPAYPAYRQAGGDRQKE
ncbi:MAG: hypothetical protein ABIH76_04165 [Candidatus Bathyarchaeota archaeon]